MKKLETLFSRPRQFAQISNRIAIFLSFFPKRLHEASLYEFAVKINGIVV